ncbi:MAG: cupin domain-containing protein, partial [Bdellovibrionota bacterium]
GMKRVVNLLDHSKLDFVPWSKRENFAGSSAEFAKDWGASKLGFHHEILDPGTFSCPYHSHREEEELFIVFSGSAMCRQDGEFFEIKKGDLVWFKTGVSHQFFNHTEEPFVFFALSNNTENEVCTYPDSNKMYDAGTRVVTQGGVVVDDYWKDEENPRPHWPEHIVSRK